MLDPEIARSNEIEFLLICTHYHSLRGSMSDIIALIRSLTYFGSFDLSEITNLSKEIFGPKYTPTKLELAKMLSIRGYSQFQIAKKIGMSRPTIQRYLNSDKVLYPRGTESQEYELNRFLEVFRKLTQLDFSLIV